MRTKKRAAPSGTIVELLTVISVIIIIIAMIVPGINYTRKIAREQVRAQIKGCAEGVEAFCPTTSSIRREAAPAGRTARFIPAAKLATALVGVDLKEYDPQAFDRLAKRIPRPMPYKAWVLLRQLLPTWSSASTAEGNVYHAHSWKW